MSMLGARLKAVRNRKGMSQGQVARYAKVAQSTLSELERGEIAPKTIDALVNLAGYFGCSVDYLLGVSNEFRPAENRYASEAALDAINLIDSLPPEKRPATVAVLRAIIELMEVGVPLPDPIQDADFARFEPVEARDGGG
jgi:transcriptional regulator with XRE-family HTH domain